MMMIGCLAGVGTILFGLMAGGVGIAFEAPLLAVIAMPAVLAPIAAMAVHQITRKPSLVKSVCMKNRRKRLSA